MKTSPDDTATQALPAASPRVRMQKMSLVISRGPDAGRRVLIEKDRLVAGKDPACELFLADATVSRKHFTIERQYDGFVIRDCKSTNGTVVDDIRINEAFLAPGSRIVAGNVELLFQPIYQTHDGELPGSESFGSLRAASNAMKPILGLLRKAASSGTTVLIRGETGVGKSALARALHDEGKRSSGPFVVFDCAAVPPTLIESELFGAAKGAYTGAVKSRPGACEQAQGGTLFLDEIGDLPQELQPKLLRVLEEREVRRLGATKPISLDIQLVSATKFDLATMARQGTFRRDLYYRIAVIDVEIPPLRERREDIPLLSDLFCRDAQRGDVWERLAPALRDELLSYSWPGNLRELRNVLERLRCIGIDGMLPEQAEIAEGDAHLAFDFNFDRPFKVAKEELIDAFEREYLARLLNRSKGRIAPAAREAGLNRKYFYDLLRKHGLHGR